MKKNSSSNIRWQILPHVYIGPYFNISSMDLNLHLYQIVTAEHIESLWKFYLFSGLPKFLYTLYFFFLISI